jgi:hypothetical protein
MAKITFILILISISTLATAADWRYITTDANGNTWHLDAESIIVERDTKTYWVLWQLKEPEVIPDSGGNIYYAMKLL